MRLVVFAAVGIVGAGAVFAQDMGSAAQSESAQPGPPGRYAIVPAGEGFVRLDTQTGMVSHCGRQEGHWRCEPAVESSGEVFAALESLDEKLVALGEQVGDLSVEIARLRQRTETLEKATIRSDEAKLSPTEQEEMDRVLRFTDQVMRRLFGMAAEMKRAEDTGKKNGPTQ